jgi:sporulation protein YlmC with PRC-barrel domain
MSIEAAQYTIGAEVRCEDASCGKLTRVVVDPVARKLTHLVVDPGKEPSRLVPVGLVGPADHQGGIQLRCSEKEFADLTTAEETEFLPGDGAGAPDGYGYGYGSEQMMVWPFYSMGVGAVGMGGAAVIAPGTQPRTTTYDRVPSGEVQIRRGETVEATDGDVGRVQGLVIDPQDHGVTHVLLQEGHLWGKKTVAIPIGSVTHVGSNVQVRLSKAELGDLPPVGLAELN